VVPPFAGSVSSGQTDVMTSWRDSASQQSQDDLDGLLGTCLPLAQRFLNESGEFYPFGAKVTLDGETEMVMAHPGPGGENPASADVVEALVEALRVNESDTRAAAVVSNFRTTESDVIRVDLEHRDGHALVVVLPYEATPGGGIEYRVLQAGSGTRRVWKN